MNRKLVLKHIGKGMAVHPGTLVLHDEDTGLVIAGQKEVTIDNVNNIVTVKFFLDGQMLKVETASSNTVVGIDFKHITASQADSLKESEKLILLGQGWYRDSRGGMWPPQAVDLDGSSDQPLKDREG